MNRHVFMQVMVALMLLIPQITHSQDDDEEIFVDPNQSEIDSLLNAINNDISNIDKAWNYYRISYIASNNDTCLKYAFISLDYCKQTDTLLLAKCYSNIGYAYYMKDDTRKALQYRFKAADLYKKISDRENEAVTLMSIGKFYEDLNEVDSIFFYYNKALEYFIEVQDTGRLVSLYFGMDQAYRNLQINTNTDIIIQKALELVTLTKDTLKMAYCYAIIGESYISDSTYRSIEYLKKSLHMYESIKIKNSSGVNDMHYAYSQLARAYIKIANINGKKEYADSCHICLKKIGNYYQSISSYYEYLQNQYSYIEYLVFYKRYNDALVELLKIEELAKNGSMHNIEEYYYWLYIVYSNLGNFKNALKSYEIFAENKLAYSNISTASSIKNAEKKRVHMLDSLNHHYETLRIKEEHEQEIKRKQGEVYIILSVFAVVLLVSVILFRWYRTNKQKNELMLKHKALEIERTLLRSQMNPHFIFNAMNSIQHFIATNQTGEAERYLSKFAKLIRFVLDSSMKQSVPLADEIQFLSFYLDIEQVRFTGKFTYKFDIDDNVEEDFIGVPPMLLQPLIENSIVHGVMHKEDGMGQITIRIEEYDKDTLRCSVIDNGIGRKASAILNQERNKTHKSIGMQLTRERLKDLNKPENAEKSYVVTDLEDGNGKALGTKTTILMPVYAI